ncbi:MAG: L-glutamate gamma-semialdehyde dehydrogenase [candidate division Zixibacteria bacterium]
MSKFSVPYPKNEPILDYAPGSSEYNELQKALAKLKNSKIEVTSVIGGKVIKGGKKVDITAPHNHKLLLGHYYKGTEETIHQSIKVTVAAQKDWSEFPWEHRASIFLKAADLLAGPYRHQMNAATMLAHSKTIFQAEIDAVCELVDFWRFNAFYMQQIYEMQPESSKGIWNRMDHRPLEGFIFAVTPFNFVSINGNLPTAPAMVGNVVLWKPASTSAYTSYFILKILREAGLPDGVINMLFANSPDVGKIALHHPDLAGVHFTGSTAIFQSMWQTIGGNIAKYRTYPRIVGETGGKDFIVAHPSAKVDEIVTAIIRGAFEYQGQKCSAASRCYLPESLWEEARGKLVSLTNELKMGDPTDHKNFCCGIIDGPAYKTIVEYIEYAKSSQDCEIISGGDYDESEGWFVRPTIVVTTNPNSKMLSEEIFGPVMTIYVYKDADFEKTLNLVDSTSPYSLTGAVFSTDRAAVVLAESRLRHAAGNFYINDKPTGAVVGQQPFGGGRASGTNDKAGGIQNMLRWVSPRSIKETLVPPTDYRYPYMG